MSGGSMNYIYSSLENESYNIKEPDIRELVKDLAELLHDMEWYDSGDYSEGTYNLTLEKFRNKWLCGDSDERIKNYVNKSCKEIKSQLMGMIGCKFYCKDCEHFTKESDSDYGKCEYGKRCRYHYYNSACEKFEVGE